MSQILEAALLGLIQGLTEFLPVSSSGHLAVFEALLGWDDPGGNLTFNVAVHVGSLGAVVQFVWRDLLDVLTTKRRLLFTPQTPTAIRTSAHSTTNSISPM